MLVGIKLAESEIKNKIVFGFCLYCIVKVSLSNMIEDLEQHKYTLLELEHEIYDADDNNELMRILNQLLKETNDMINNIQNRITYK